MIIKTITEGNFSESFPRIWRLLALIAIAYCGQVCWE